MKKFFLNHRQAISFGGIIIGIALMAIPTLIDLDFTSEDNWENGFVLILVFIGVALVLAAGLFGTTDPTMDAEDEQ